MNLNKIVKIDEVKTKTETFFFKFGVRIKGMWETPQTPNIFPFFFLKQCLFSGHSSIKPGSVECTAQSDQIVSEIRLHTGGLNQCLFAPGSHSSDSANHTCPRRNIHISNAEYHTVFHLHWVCFRHGIKKEIQNIVLLGFGSCIGPNYIRNVLYSGPHSVS